MKRLLLIFVAATAAAQAPLSDAQRITVLQAQLDLRDVQLEIASLESRLKDLYRILPQAQAAKDEAVKSVTPKGWVLQPDLTLAKEPVK